MSLGQFLEGEEESLALLRGSGSDKNERNTFFPVSRVPPPNGDSLREAPFGSGGSGWLRSLFLLLRAYKPEGRKGECKNMH